MINVGVIGYGYWGRNIVRNFFENKDTKITAVCDTELDALRLAQDTYPGINIFSDAYTMINSSNIDAVAIVTPMSTQFELTKHSLKNKKHVFVEKPFVSTSQQAEYLIEVSEKNQLTMMIDYTFLFSNAVRKIKELIDRNMLGELHYFDSVRINFGPFRHDCNVVWDLATHDFSIIDYLIEEKPIAITTVGKSLFCNKLEDIGYITVYFSNNFIAHFHVNWIYPFKVRITSIAGGKKILVWDDLNSSENIKVYNKRAIIKKDKNLYKLLPECHSDNAWIPKLEQKEALKTEIEHFVDCILNNKTPLSSGYMGLRIIKMLEAANKSLKNKGRIIEL